MPKKVIGGLVAAGLVAVAAYNADYSDPMTGKSPENISQAWANIKTNAGLTLLNSAQDRSEITPNDLDKVLTAKEAMSSMGGCCHFYNDVAAKSATYKIVVASPYAQGRADEVNRVAEAVRQREENTAPAYDLQPANMTRFRLQSLLPKELSENEKAFIERRKAAAGCCL